MDFGQPRNVRGAAQIRAAPRARGRMNPCAGSIGLAQVIHNTPPRPACRIDHPAGFVYQDKSFARWLQKWIGRSFPLSNPTDRSEASPADLLRWTEGTERLVATGSPVFLPSNMTGARLEIGQCNNAYIFPAVGLAIESLENSSRHGLHDARRRAGAGGLFTPQGRIAPRRFCRRSRTFAGDFDEIAYPVGIEARRTGLIPMRAMRTSGRDSKTTSGFPTIRLPGRVVFARRAYHPVGLP